MNQYTDLHQAQLLHRQWPHIKFSKCLKWAQAYSQEVARQVIPKVINNRLTEIQHSDIPQWKFSINLTEARTRLKQVRGITGRAQWLFTEVHRTAPLFVVTQLGDNLRSNITEARINQTALDSLLDQPVTELELKNHWPELSSEHPDWIPIDLASLQTFISNCELALLEPRTAAQRKGLAATHIQAQCLLRLTQALQQLGYTAEPALPVFQQVSEYGRSYHQGPNLQSARSSVRRAALGNCWEYDLEAAQYAIRLWFAEQALTARGQTIKAKFTYTREYLEIKSGVRDRLANLLPEPWPRDLRIKLIKQVINAIGFGATARSGGYTDSQGQWRYRALSEIIKKPAALAVLLADAWLQEFTQEQAQINALLYECWYDDKNPRHTQVLKNYRLPASRHRQFACWLYQHTERAVITDITTQWARGPVLAVHDAVYTLQRLPIVDVKYWLSEQSPWLKISSEYHPAVQPAQPGTNTGSRLRPNPLLYTEQGSDIVQWDREWLLAICQEENQDLE